MTANSSMPVRHVILVDENDQQVGTCEKLKAHELGLRHRAFSIVLLKIVDDEVYTLIQKRKGEIKSQINDLKFELNRLDNVLEKIDTDKIDGADIRKILNKDGAQLD